jgi:hypothetical protein
MEDRLPWGRDVIAAGFKMNVAKTELRIFDSLRVALERRTETEKNQVKRAIVSGKSYRLPSRKSRSRL